MQRVAVIDSSAKAEESPPLLPKRDDLHKKNCWPQKTRKILSITTIVILLLTALLVFYKNSSSANRSRSGSAELMPPNPETKLPPSYTSLHIFKNAAVCSDSEVCSRIGRDIFTRNGSVMDATLATMFCAGMTNMQSMGVGGGFIMNIFIQNENKAYTLDAREISAGAATEGMHLHDPSTTNEGPLSIAVPGELKGYWEAHKRFGTLPWRDVIQPAIDICNEGFEMSKHMYDSMHTNIKIKFDEELRKMYVDENTGEFRKQGSIIKPGKLCKTLEHIADKGGDDMYHGELAQLLADDLQDMGSIITKSDLEQYEVLWSESIPIDINGDTMYVIPPPASGVLISFIVNILKGYKFSPKSLATVNDTALTYHRIVEAYKFAYGKRTEVGDPKFMNIDELVTNLTSPEYAEQIRLKIDDHSTKTDPREYGGNFYIKDSHGTAHISVVGPNGDAVSVTSSVNFYFGAAMSGKRTGIIVNSGMDDFSSPGLENYFGLPGSEPNYIRPHKRALSSMSPTIVVDKDNHVKMVVGAAGGTKITTAVAMAIMRHLWFGSDIKQAVDAPRFHHQLIPMEIQYEYGNLDGVLKGLEAIGHKTKRYRERGSIICGITKNTTGVYANADFRKGGDVVGF